MSIIRLIITLALMPCSLASFAQFSNGHNTNTFASSNAKSYRRFDVGFTLAKMTYGGHTANDSEKGITAELIFGRHISSTMPIFVEYGVRTTWLHNSSFTGSYSPGDYVDYFDDVKLNYWNAAIPINLVYNFILNETITIRPFVGFNAKANMLAIMDYDEQSFDCLDKNDIYYEEDAWARFQIGMNIGIGVNFDNMYIGYTYQPDFSELAAKVKYPSNTICFGIYF